MNSGKTILLIAPQYFNYDRVLSDYLVSCGFTVDLLPDRPVDTTIGKALIRMNRKLLLPMADRFFMRGIKAAGRGHYDAILVIQGEALSPTLLNWLRVTYPDGPMIWYLWDSMKNKPALTDNLSYFDCVYSFDPHDARSYGMGFRPLFFSPDYAQLTHAEKAFDLCFIGTAHDDRFPVVKEIVQSLPTKNVYTFLYMQSRLLYAWRRLSDRNLRLARRSDFSFGKLPQSEVRKIIAQSDIVLDIQHPAQHGLTIRTLEVLGAGKKLVTTNTEIKDYDFYNENNIMIVDRKFPSIPDEFFQRVYQPVADCTLEYYSINGFLKSLLGDGFFR